MDVCMCVCMCTSVFVYIIFLYNRLMTSNIEYLDQLTLNLYCFLADYCINRRFSNWSIILNGW